MSDGLFADVAGPEEEEGFTLWYRPSKRHKWRAVATGRTMQEVLAHMSEAGSGEFYPAEAGTHPDDTK